MVDTVKRYAMAPTGTKRHNMVLTESIDGEYVEYSDYQSLQTQLDELHGAKFSDRCYHALKSRAETAETQLSELREENERKNSRRTNAMLNGCSVEGWECFHCGELFTTVGGARDHFGGNIHDEPGCIIKVKLGDERGLLMELRKAQDRIRALESDIENDTTGTAVYSSRLESELASYKPFRNCKSIYNVFCLYDSLEGELIAEREQSQARCRALEEGIKTAAVSFFQYWWNQPGSNTEQGYDEWVKNGGLEQTLSQTSEQEESGG